MYKAWTLKSDSKLWPWYTVSVFITYIIILTEKLLSLKERLCSRHIVSCKVSIDIINHEISRVILVAVYILLPSTSNAACDVINLIHIK